MAVPGKLGVQAGLKNFEVTYETRMFKGPGGPLVTKVNETETGLFLKKTQTQGDGTNSTRYQATGVTKNISLSLADKVTPSIPQIPTTLLLLSTRSRPSLMLHVLIKQHPETKSLARSPTFS